MLDDTDGTKFNKVLVSIICDYIYQRDNERTPLDDCYRYITGEIGISTTKDHLKNIIANVDYVLTEPINHDILLHLQVDVYDKLCHSSDASSVEFHAREFLRREALPLTSADNLVNMIHQSIYENIQGIASGNVKNLLAEEIKGKFPVEEIILFNKFLDYENRSKDNAIFKLFYKALEFAIVTSGTGVQDFAANIFKGKVYLLDTNVIFRMMGINGIQERANVEELISACLHQGVEFHYTQQTFNELTRKREQAIQVLKRFNNSANALVEDTIISGDINIKNDFTNQYYGYRKIGVVSTPEQYELKLLAEFRHFESIYKLKPVDTDIQIDSSNVEALSHELLEEKKSRGAFRYTGSAAQVDAYNILYVKHKRTTNNFSFSDVKCFYLSTDRTLAEILKSRSKGQGVSEMLTPAQAFLLHTSLSNNPRGIDFVTFTKFLKKNIIEQEFTGVEVVRYVNQVSSMTTDPNTISALLKAYSDKRYTKTSNYEAEFSLPTFSEFAKTELETQLDIAHQRAEDAERAKSEDAERARILLEQEASKSQSQIEIAMNAHNIAAGERDAMVETINSAFGDVIGRHLKTSLGFAKSLEVISTIIIGAIALLVKDKVHSHVLMLGIALLIVVVLANLFFSSKLSYMSRLWKSLFLRRVRNSDMYRAEATRDKYYAAAITNFDKVANNNLWAVKLK